MKQLLNHKYAQLASQLGDVTFKLHKLEKQYDALVAEIELLNAMTPQLTALHEQNEKTKKTSEVQKSLEDKKVYIGDGSVGTGGNYASIKHEHPIIDGPGSAGRPYKP